MVKKIIYGEFKCPKCDAVFFQKHLLVSHSGTHVKGTKPICSVCKDPLTVNRNWIPSLVKISRRICSRCLKAKNKENYRNRKQRKLEAIRSKK